MCEELTLNSLICYQLPEYVLCFNIEAIQGSHKIYEKDKYKYSISSIFKIRGFDEVNSTRPLVTNVL